MPCSDPQPMGRIPRSDQCALRRARDVIALNNTSRTGLWHSVLCVRMAFVARQPTSSLPQLLGTRARTSSSQLPSLLDNCASATVRHQVLPHLSAHPRGTSSWHLMGSDWSCRGGSATSAARWTRRHNVNNCVGWGVGRRWHGRPVARRLRNRRGW